MIMKRLLIFAAFAAVIAACKEPRSWCPNEVTVPFVSADIPDTVDARQKFTADFVLHKGVCIKEYGVVCYIKQDSVLFYGAAIQDYCDEFPDTASVEKSLTLMLGDYDRYIVIYPVIDSVNMLVNSAYDFIVVRK